MTRKMHIVLNYFFRVFVHPTHLAPETTFMFNGQTIIMLCVVNLILYCLYCVNQFIRSCIIKEYPSVCFNPARKFLSRPAVV